MPNAVVSFHKEYKKVTVKNQDEKIRKNMKICVKMVYFYAISQKINEIKCNNKNIHLQHKNECFFINLC